MQPIESMYRGWASRPMSAVARALATASRPRMVYGFKDPETGKFRKYTRVGSNVVIMGRHNLSMADHVWVFHHSVLDASAGLSIGEGVQIGSWVGIFTHGSEAAIRLLGRDFVHLHHSERKGYTRGPVTIGDYAFIGSGAVVLAGRTVGRGSLVSPLALINRDVPDYAIAVGNPARIVGDTRDVDAKHFADTDFSRTYYDQAGLASLSAKPS